jgi:hypothetical protein
MGSARCDRRRRYARPHLLDIAYQPTGPPQFPATIEYITIAGPLVKVELATETGTVVHMEVSQERYRRLGLRKEIMSSLGPRICSLPSACQRRQTIYDLPR